MFIRPFGVYVYIIGKGRWRKLGFQEIEFLKVALQRGLIDSKVAKLFQQFIVEKFLFLNSNQATRDFYAITIICPPQIHESVSYFHNQYPSSIMFSIGQHSVSIII